MTVIAVGAEAITWDLLERSRWSAAPSTREGAA
jgi:hypothetical protein